MGLKEYLDFFEEEFNKMTSSDKRILGVPIISFVFWVVYGLIMPNIIIPISYFLKRKWLK